MITIGTNVQWGSSPKIYFDFAYDKKREGSTQYYSVAVTCRELTGSHYFGYPIYLEIYLDGVRTRNFTIKEASPSRWNTTYEYQTGWMPVNNKTSGTTALKIRLYSGMGSTRDVTYGYSLAIDPAASPIACTTANIGSNPTITIAKASSSFTHSVSYAFGSLKGDIAIKTSATSIADWTIPEEFYAQIPNAKTGKGTLTCITYSGGTPVGNPTTCELNVTTDEQKCKPTVSGTVVDTNDKTIALTGNPDILVKFCSKAKCTIGVTLNKNAGSVKAKTINNIAVSGNTLEIPNVEVGTFDFYAKDSREYPNSDKVIKTLVPYVKLTANVTAQRADPTSGNATLQIEGNYFNGNFGAKDNTLTVKYRQGNGDYVTVTPTISNNTYRVTASLTGVDYTKSFTYEVVVEDKISAVTKTATIQKGIPVFDWGEEDFNFNVPVLMQGVPIADFIVGQGIDNNWAWRKWNSGIAECWRYYPFTPTATGNQSVSVSYPFSFIGDDYPIVTATLGMNGTLATNVIACNEAGNLPNKERVCNLFLRGITNTAYQIAIHIYAVGRWK